MHPNALYLLSVAVASRRSTVLLDPAVVDQVEAACGVRVDRGVRAESGERVCSDRGQRVGPGQIGRPQRRRRADSVAVWPIGQVALFSVLDLVGRDDSLVVAIWLSPPSQRETSTIRSIELARRAPSALVLAPATASRPVASVATSLLRLHLTTLRSRTAAQWHTIDAHRRSGRANLAAVELGCSHQNVTKSLARSGVKTTDATLNAFIALLGLAADEE